MKVQKDCPLWTKVGVEAEEEFAEALLNLRSGEEPVLGATRTLDR